MFPTRQPRHVAEGAVNLAKSVAAGLSLSVVSVVGLPVAGFRQAGWIGLVAGSLAGTVYGAVFAVLGVANGAYQMARGALETPRALQAARQGFVWDGSTWKVYSFAEEQAMLQDYTNEGGGGSSSSVRDPRYYRVLNVATDATPSQIKRAYYDQARSVHPDKNPDADPEAFRQLHTAYITLHDPKQRAIYDEWGPNNKPNGSGSSVNIPDVDMYLFFAILFHTSAVIEPYIGDLSLASFSDTVMHAMRTQPQQPEDVYRLLLTGRSSKSRRQQQRQLDVALYLQRRVVPYSTANDDDDTATAFRTACRTEAAHMIASGPYGSRFAHVIGSALVLEGGQFERAWWTAGAVLLQSSLRGLRSTLSLVRESWDVIQILSKLKPRQRPPEDKLIKEMLDVAWAFNEKDIRTTLRGACMRLFADARNMQERVLRAQAVQIMGQELLRAAAANPPLHEGPAKKTASNMGNGTVGEDDLLLVRAEVAFTVAMQVSKDLGPSTSQSHLYVLTLVA